MRYNGTSHEAGNKGNNNALVMGRDRREHRRHDLEQQEIPLARFDSHGTSPQMLGKILDISAGGVRVRTPRCEVRPDQQIRVRLDLPAYAGISPFVAPSAKGLEPRGQWVGWMTISRVVSVDEEEMEVAGCLVDMDEMDRGMLGLYLSTQPLAA
jgi:hypothetical protein